MKWYWIIPICLLIVGYFGIFWTLNIRDITIKFEMDNNTLEAVKAINYTALSEVGNNPFDTDFTCDIPAYVFYSNKSYSVIFNKERSCSFIEN